MGEMSHRRLLAAVLGMSISLIGVTAVASSTAVADQHASNTRPPAVTRADLNHAWVPSLCDHHPGHLRHGVLPHVPHDRGVVELASLTRHHAIALGVITPGSNGDAVAVVECNAGGVPWPDNIELYRAGMHLIGNIELGTSFKHSESPFVHAVAIAHRRVRVEVENIQQHGDPACCGSESALLTLGWDRSSGTVVVMHTRVMTERPTAVRLVRAVKHGDRAVARQYATAKVVRAMMRLRGDAPAVAGCYGRESRRWPSSITTRDDRFCAIDTTDQTYGLFLGKRTWDTYRANRLVDLAG